MAKKVATIRVFQLAKDIGVTSKDIVAKCQAEGIENITNHMSAVSMGLSATVREWFGEGQSSATTAIETAAPVDVVKARAKVKKKTQKKTATKTVTAAVPTTEEAPQVEAVAETVVVVAAPPLPIPPPAEPPPPPQPVPEAPVVPALVPAAIAPTPVDGPPKMNIPDRPEVISPVGPMLAMPTGEQVG